MFKIREKLERSLSRRASENRLLRLFRSSFQPSFAGQEAADHEDFFAGSQNETRIAMLEAERMKTLAIMALQQQHQRFS